MVILGWLAAAVAIVLIDARPLLKNKLRKELVVFSIFMLTGLGMGILLSVQVQLPSPLAWISAVYGPVSDAVLSMLK